jgi:predicted RNase H-like nuclease (RuvC/YqgF family)
MISVWTCLIIGCGGIIVMALICELDRAAERKEFKAKIAELQKELENKKTDETSEAKYKKQITELQNHLAKKNETIKMQNTLLNNELPHLRRELGLQIRRNAKLTNQIQQMMILKAKYETLKDTMEAQNGK